MTQAVATQASRGRRAGRELPMPGPGCRPHPGFRRLPRRHRLPRHRVHRDARAHRAVATRCGPTGWDPARVASANLAVACARLGLRTSLAAAFGGDVYGDFCWTMLEEAEGIDLSRSQRFEGWHSPVTVSLAFDEDRAMVTHGHPAPAEIDDLIGHTPHARSLLLRRRRAAATRGWTAPSPGRQRWSSPTSAGTPPAAGTPTALRRPAAVAVHAFVPNAAEAMAYTRTDSPGARAGARCATGSRSPSSPPAPAAPSPPTPRPARPRGRPAVPVDVLDPTGAGDVFLAALVVGTLRGWPLQQRLRFANLCAAPVRPRLRRRARRARLGRRSRPGGPTVATATGSARDYAFLDEVIPPGTAARSRPGPQPPSDCDSYPPTPTPTAPRREAE